MALKRDVLGLLMEVVDTPHFYTTCCDSKSVVLSGLEFLPFGITDERNPNRCRVVHNRTANCIVD